MFSFVTMAGGTSEVWGTGVRMLTPCNKWASSSRRWVVPPQPPWVLLLLHFTAKRTEIWVYHGFPSGTGLWVDEHPSPDFWLFPLSPIKNEITPNIPDWLGSTLPQGKVMNWVTFQSSINHSHSGKGQIQGQILIGYNGWNGGKGKSWSDSFSWKRLSPTSSFALPQHGELFLALWETGPDRIGISRKCWGPRGKENAF